MRCPNCGQWNQASFPRCFKCGTPLPAAAMRDHPLPAEEMERKKAEKPQDTPIRITLDEQGFESRADDAKDRLAREMLSFHDRKKRGEKLQRQLKEEGARRGYAPTGTKVSGARRGGAFPPAPVSRDPYRVRGDERIDYDGYTQGPSYARTLDGFAERERISGTITLPKKRMKRARLFGIRRFLPLLALLLLAAAALSGGYFFLFKPLVLDEKVVPEDKQVQISASLLDENAAHTVSIPAGEGTQIYVKELRKSYLVTGGYASFQVPDHIWYDHLVEDPNRTDSWLPETMDVTLTPFVRAETGEQVPLPPVHYTISIPQSPLTLLNPDVTYVDTSMPLYNIRFKVMTNSQVFINNEDFSSYVNTQDGLISYNAPIQPIGDNKITITVRSQYYRMNSITLTIHRAVQDIPLDLAATTGDESSRDRMPIYGTTRAGATLTVLTPHEKLNTDELATRGAFNFNAIFDRYGENIIRIQADYPGKNSTVIEYRVNYLPNPNNYTTKAWALNDGFGYADLLANLSKRIEKTQVYLVTGTVEEIVSDRPQLVIVDAGDGKTSSPLRVMLENQTKRTWELGKRYTIYADAYGMYNTIPRLVARYTYIPKDNPPDK